MNFLPEPTLRSRFMARTQMSEDLSQQAARALASSAPPVVVTLYTLVSKGLPFIISLLTLTYLAIQISYLVNKWWREAKRRREIDRALDGPVPGYKPRIPR